MRKGTVEMSMTLEQIDAKLKEADQYNALLATRKQGWVEGIQKEFGVSTSEELKKMLTDVEAQLAVKNAEYDKACAEAEELLKKAGVTC